MSASADFTLPNPARGASLEGTLGAWRRAFTRARPLERAYLFVHLIQDARLLRGRAEAALVHGPPGASSAAWWTPLLPQPRGLESWEAALAERCFWRRFDGGLVPELPGELFGDALAWAQAATLLREGPDGHAILALAEIGAGEWSRGAQRLAAIEARDWRQAAEQPARVAARLALAKAALADKQGDRLGVLRELQGLAALDGGSAGLLAALLVLNLEAGDIEGLESVLSQWGRGDVPRTAGSGPAWAPLRSTLLRWSGGFSANARLHLGYLLERCGAADPRGGSEADPGQLVQLLRELARVGSHS